MDTYRYQTGGYEYRCRSNEYISDSDLYRDLRPAVRPQDGYGDQFSFQRNHRFYSSVPRNYDRRKQEFRREIHYDEEDIPYNEVKRSVETAPQYPLRDAKQFQMYQTDKKEISGNTYDSIKRKPKKAVNYGSCQGYDDGGFQNDRTQPASDGPNVVVNLNSTGNGVNTVLRNGTYSDHNDPTEVAQDNCCLSRLCLCSATQSDTPLQAEDNGICKPPLLLLLLVVLIIVFVCVSAVLLYLNYATLKPRLQIIEEPCETTFCSFGSTCVTESDGRTHCKCPTSCPSSYSPVCGTDNKVYTNECVLRQTSCQKQITIRILHEGKCGEFSFD